MKETRITLVNVSGSIFAVFAKGTDWDSRMCKQSERICTLGIGFGDQEQRLITTSLQRTTRETFTACFWGGICSTALAEAGSSWLPLMQEAAVEIHLPRRCCVNFYYYCAIMLWYSQGEINTNSLQCKNKYGKWESECKWRKAKETNSSLNLLLSLTYPQSNKQEIGCSYAHGSKYLSLSAVLGN